MTALNNAHDVCDRVVNHLFGSGLTLASILSRQRVGDEVADQLRDVIEGLDAALHELQSGALARLVRERDAYTETPQRGTTSLAMPDPVTEVRAVQADGPRRLYRVADEEAFAYAMRRYDFFRARDHTSWAHEHDGLLVSERSSMPFARRVGNVFYDIESNVPLYCEDGHAWPLPVRHSAVSPATSPRFWQSPTAIEEVLE